MASELRITTLANNAGTESVDTTYVVNGSLKAWCTWSMTDTGNPYDSLNISSITDDTAVINTFAYSNSFSTVAGQCVTTAHNANSSSRNNYSSSDLQVYNPSASGIKVVSQSNNNPAYCCMHTSGDLA
jgi:hypothetical protein